MIEKQCNECRWFNCADYETGDEEYCSEAQYDYFLKDKDCPYYEQY